MMTVLGSFQGSGGGGSTGTDFTNGGTMKGSLTINGGLTLNSGMTVANGVSVVGSVSAAAARFGELWINDVQVDFDNLPCGGGNAAMPPREPQPIGDAEHIQDGYRYIITNDDTCAGWCGYVFTTPVCAYAQAEIWIDNSDGPVYIAYPSDWLWRNDCTCNPRLYDSACISNAGVPQAVCGNMQVIKIRHDGRVVLANLAYQYPLSLQPCSQCSC